MAITRIKNNQITDATINAGTKLVDKSITAGKIVDDLTYGSNLTVTGNLTVNGTSTTVNSTTMSVDDPMMVLAPDQSGAGALDLGFIGERGTDTNVAFVWDESDDEFAVAFTSDADSSTTVTITDYADLRVGGLAVDDNVTVGGTMDVTGAITLNANMDANSNKITNLSDPTNAQDAATKAYVDAELSAGWILSDGTTDQTIDVSASDTLTVSGTANEITAVVSATDTLTIGLPDDVTIGNDLTVTTDLDIGGGNFTVAGASGNTATQGTLAVTGTSSFTGDMTAGNIDSSTLDTTGNATVGGTLEVTGASTFTGDMTAGNIDSTTLDASGNATVGGTFDVTGATTLSSTLDVTGAANFNATTGSTSTSTGAVIIDGGLGVAENAYVGGNIVVTGNLTVNGTTTTVESTVTTIADPVMTLGQNDTTDSKDRGIEFKYNDGSAKVGFFGWDNSAGGFTLLTGATNTSEAFSGTAAPFDMGALTATTGDFSSTLNADGNTTLGGTLAVTGTSSFTGDMTAGNIDSSTLDASGNVTIGGTLDVTGNQDNTGNLSVGGTFSSTGEATLASATVSDLTDNRIVIAGTAGSLEDDSNLTFDGTTFEVGTLFDVTAASGNTAIGGTLTVTGVAALNSGITVDTTAFTVANTTGNVSTAGTLNADGATTLGDTLDVTGATTLSSTLDVTGATSLDNAVVINESGADVDFRVEGDTSTHLLFVDASNDSVQIGTSSSTAEASLKMGTTDSFIIASGTTAQRPATGVQAMMRYNTTNNGLEYHNGTAWKNMTAEFTVITADSFSGDNSTTAFTLSTTGTTATTIVSINGVVQVPTTAYGVSGTTLTFTEAPATGDVIDARVLTTTASVTGLDDGTGTVTMDTNAGSGSFDVKGDILPTADNTYDLGSSSNKWANVYATTFTGTATAAQYADLAEKYTADADIEPGTVVCFGGDAEVTTCNHDMDTKVAGVVSTNPAHLMNDGIDGVAVALTGRVPCKVTGPVSKGDMMVSAGNGMARAEANPAMGSVIGKALGNNEDGEGIIEVVVGRM